MANRSGDNFYNETGQSFNNNPASLKGKLQTLEVLILLCSNKSRTSPMNLITIKRKFKF